MFHCSERVCVAQKDIWTSDRHRAMGSVLVFRWICKRPLNEVPSGGSGDDSLSGHHCQVPHYKGVAWAQYDRGFRKQMAKLKDLRWSRLNTTLFSLCVVGKAKRNTVCAWFLADSHDTESCPDKPPKADWKCQKWWWLAVVKVGVKSLLRL